VLVDKKVHVHPDLGDAVSGDDIDSTDRDLILIAEGRQTADIVAWQDDYHGTHMAGIIAARDNKFGLVGVDPEARVTSWNWEALRTRLATAARAVGRRQRDAANRGSLQIYTFAVDWPAPPNVTVETRTSLDQLAKRLVDEKPLVVVAAGQAASAAAAVRITATNPTAPANLGDQENVLVVTACERCTGPNASILPEANYSRQFVHVAAPGTDVLSTAFGGKYSRASGTSQATAFVTGLASFMVSRFPSKYQDAYQVKVRLQVTSTPFELVGTAIAGRDLATGIVSPSVALLDPSEHWVKRNGVAHAMVTDAHHATQFTWKPENLYLENDDGNRVTVVLDDVWRLVRLPGGDRWVVYKGKRKGPIEKVGPWKLFENEGDKVLFAIGAEDIKPSMFEDLVLAYPSGLE
jgi:subtilisin family serine protease